MNGMVFDIQRFSVHDGPGIRTTVFCKGCPLRCRWCHNPEGLCAGQQVWYQEEMCIHCGQCGKRDSVQDAALCPTGAFRICGEQMSAEDVYREIMKDLPYYGETGGVTFSGGECLLQADFVAEVLSLCKAQGLSTAVDTCGYVPWNAFEKVMDVCDLFLYDVKMMNRDKHQLYTGVDPALIHENLQRLAALGQRVWIRVPVIPGVNDTDEEMLAIARYLQPMRSVEKAEVMPYHTLGKSKYEALGMTCLYHTDDRIAPERLQQLQNMMNEVIFHA